jgi:hypothetical protein
MSCSLSAPPFFPRCSVIIYSSPLDAVAHLPDVPFDDVSGLTAVSLKTEIRERRKSEQLFGKPIVFDTPN